MKEDGARRRAIELLLTELYGGSPQLLYRHKFGSELADDIWDRFNHQCFNCGKPLQTAKEMHLDHTRPLALLWPLDETATALCEDCNNDKRDRPPVDFYSLPQLEELSQITGIALPELLDPSPNMDAVTRLIGRLDWFFDEFLTQPRMIREHDGKVPAELLIKALQKTLNKCFGGSPVNLLLEYEKRQGN